MNVEVVKQGSLPRSASLPVHNQIVELRGKLPIIRIADALEIFQTHAPFRFVRVRELVVSHRDIEDLGGSTSSLAASLAWQLTRKLWPQHFRIRRTSPRRPVLAPHRPPRLPREASLPERIPASSCQFLANFPATGNAWQVNRISTANHMNPEVLRTEINSCVGRPRRS